MNLDVMTPGHLWLEPPVLCHWATTAGRPPTLTILYVYWVAARCATEAFSTICAALAAQARGVLGSTPGDCRLFHFPLFSPHNI